MKKVVFKESDKVLSESDLLRILEGNKDSQMVVGGFLSGSIFVITRSDYFADNRLELRCVSDRFGEGNCWAGVDDAKTIIEKFKDCGSIATVFCFENMKEFMSWAVKNYPE